MLEIKQLIESSFTDWEGKVSAVLYIGGCNLRCPYCFVPDLVENPDQLPTIPWAVVRNHLEKGKTWIDGVVISGGEPTIHEELPELCRKIQAAGFQIKLDTNGTNPEMVKELIDGKLVDYISLDVKHQIDSPLYSRAVGIESDALLKSVKRTISILLTAGVPYEFRTTIVPVLHSLEDVRNITRYLGVCKRYILQPYKSAETINPKCSNMREFDKMTLMGFLRMAQKVIPHAKLR